MSIPVFELKTDLTVVGLHSLIYFSALLTWFCDLALRFPTITKWSFVPTWQKYSSEKSNDAWHGHTSAFKKVRPFYMTVMSACLFKAQDELHILKAWMDAFTVWQIVGIVKGLCTKDVHPKGARGFRDNGHGGQKRPKMGGRPLYTVPKTNFAS